MFPVPPEQHQAVSFGHLRQEVSHFRAGAGRIAIISGGTIPDTGQYAAYTSSGVRIGELEEEFLYERRIGDVFLLGTNAWRVDRIDADRVIVLPA